ncbi:unnamed protein product [Trichobilharzia szidati]|nr:unnamed protein product [Trichobilharzia szidati]
MFFSSSCFKGCLTKTFGYFSGLSRLGPRWILYVDIVGVVRTLNERERFYAVDLDDGTGCLACTIWRPDYSQHNYSQSSIKTDTMDSEQSYICEQLVKLALKSQPVLPSSLLSSSSSLRVGQILQLRGRLNCFRGRLKLNAYFCRSIKDEGELLNHIIHRYHLHQEIYSHPYDPAIVAENVKKSHVTNLANSLVTECCRYLVEDNIQLFTKLDLCVHPKIVELITDNWTSLGVAYDETEADYLKQTFVEEDSKENESKSTTSTKTSLNSKKLQLIIHSLIERLIIEGWIIPGNQSIGGMPAYHVVKENRQLLDAVYSVIRLSFGSKESSVQSILDRVRQYSHSSVRQCITRMTLNALKHLLNQLECDSRIYQSNSGYYKVA